MAAQKRKPTTRKTPVAAKRKRGASASVGKKKSGKLANFFVPLFFMAGILFCLGFLLFMGYRTVTASAFFDVKQIELRGINRVSREEVERIVRIETEKSGVWNADLKEIKTDIEKLTAVKSAVVSRVLPNEIRVNIIERAPRAVVRIAGDEFWADDEAVILGAVGKNDLRPPFSIRGWDDGKSEKAVKDNQERVRIYLKMAEEWKQFDLASRVQIVDLSDIKTPQAVVQDSGEQVVIVLAKENFATRLQSGLERIAGRGLEIKSIDVSGGKEILSFRN